MRQLIFAFLSLLLIGLMTGEAAARTVNFAATAQQVFAGCTKAGGGFHQDGGSYGCAKANCDGKNGMCTIECTNGNCTGTTPSRLSEATSIFGIMGQGSGPVLAIDPPSLDGAIYKVIRPIKFVSAATLRAQCADAGGTFNSGPGYHSCVNNDCDGNGGSCNVTCNDGKCTGSTPSRIAEGLSIRQILGGMTVLPASAPVFSGSNVSGHGTSGPAPIE